MVGRCYNKQVHVPQTSCWFCYRIHPPHQSMYNYNVCVCVYNYVHMYIWDIIPMAHLALLLVVSKPVTIWSVVCG